MHPAPTSITVSQAIRLCNALFAEVTLTIEGEVANFSTSRGQYVFFDLKDEEQDSRLGCFMMLHQLSVPLEDGMKVVVTGRPSVFLKSGKFSITLQRVEPKGEGSLKRAFELLKKKLHEEGLFAPERKRAIPRFPAAVGIISSSGAAGYGDFMRIVEGRMKGVEFILADVAVQGKDAEAEICFAFDHLNSRHALDAIVLIRGGGSMEDLHAFNSELVARAIVRSKVPVLVGVGHERDVTIADYCADIRASTPSNAAQLLLPTADEVASQVERLVQDGQRRVQSRIASLREGVAGRLERLHQRLGYVITSTRQRVESLTRTIVAVSPEETLKRGYSIAWKADGSVARSAKDFKAGDTLITQFADSSVSSVINPS